MCDSLTMAKPVTAKRKWKPTKLRAWRVWRKMDLEDLADAMSFNIGTLSQIENGVRRYNQDVLEKAALVLRVPVSFLIDRNPPPDGAELDYSDPRLVEHVLANASPSERGEIDKFMRKVGKETSGE